MLRSMANRGVRMLESVLARPEEEKQVERPCLPRVIEKRCTGCGLCTRVCTTDILEMRGRTVAVVNPHGCWHCGHCVAVCPADALEDGLAARKRPPLLDAAALPSAESLRMFFLSRRSVRLYRRRPVSRSDLERILEVGTYAPTAGNRQDVAYIVLRSPEEIRELREMVFPVVRRMFARFHHRALQPLLEAAIGRESVVSLKEYLPLLDACQERWVERGEDLIFFNAPTLLIVHGSRFDDTVAVSCSVVLYQASLMAHAMNVGSCFNGFLQVAINYNRKVKQWLGIPWRNQCHGALTMGYPRITYRRTVRREPPRVVWR